MHTQKSALHSCYWDKGMAAMYNKGRVVAQVKLAGVSKIGV